MEQSLADFERKLKAVQDEFDGTAALKRLTAVAALTKADINAAIQGDLGDQSMSGWRRGKPVQIKGAYKVEDTEVAMVPTAIGPMRVLEQGRNQGDFTGPAASGRRTRRRKDGTSYVVGAKKAKRWNGRTQGKDTWSDAVEIMVREIPGRFAAEVHKALKRHLNGG